LSALAIGSPSVAPTRVVILAPALLALAAELRRLVAVVGPAARASLIPAAIDVVDVEASVEGHRVGLDVDDGRLRDVDHGAVVLRGRGHERLSLDVGRSRVHPPGTARTEGHCGRGEDDVANTHQGVESDHDESVPASPVPLPDTAARSLLSKCPNGGTMLLVVLLVVLVVALGGGGWAHSRYGYAGWSPAGLILLVLVVLYFSGHLLG
jgi:hypothetical protein